METTIIWVRSINKKTLAKLNESLGDTNWEFVYESDNPCKTFTEFLNEKINHFCPLKTIKPNKNHFPIKKWMTQELLRERKIKLELYKKVVRSAGESKTSNMALYKQQKSKYNSLLRTAKKKYVEEQISKNFGKSRKIWQTVNSFINRENTTEHGIKNIRTESGVTSDKLKIANTINNFYTSVGPALAAKIPTNSNNESFFPPRKETSMTFEMVSESDIMDVITQMKNKKSTGMMAFQMTLSKRLAILLN